VAPFKRDPLSELFDAGARRLLDRAYAAPGRWVSTRIADPGPAALARAAAAGIDPLERDDPPVAGGRGIDARTRWCRAFVRALYYQHRWYSGGAGRGWRARPRTVPRHAGALRVEVGRAVPALGAIPRGRAVRVRLDAGGQAAEDAVAALPASRRRVTPDGRPGPRWSDPGLRDWE
jgi:hypothetical protein